MTDRYQGIDPWAILAVLGVEGVEAALPVTGGWDTLIWRVETPTGRFALRLFRPDQEGQWRNEIFAMGVLHDLGLPVPAVRHHGMWAGRPAILMDWCEGRTALEEIRAHPERLSQIGVSMGRLHAQVHAVPVPREYWEDHRSWLAMAGLNEDELVERLRKLGLQDGHCLHLDYHPLNVLCINGEATTILDWANVTVGDPRADLARTSAILRLADPPLDIHTDIFASMRRSLEQTWMAGYRQIVGDPGEMALFHLWATIHFIRDMQTKLGMPGFWMNESDFDRLREQVTSMKRDAGLQA